MNGNHIGNLIHDYIDGTITTEQRQFVEEHIRSCNKCRKELEDMQGLVDRIRNLPKSIEPPGDMLDGIDQRLAGQQQESFKVDHRRNGKIEKNIFVLPFLKNISTAWSFRIAAMITLLVGAFAVWYTLRTSAPDAQQPVNIAQRSDEIRQSEKLSVPSETSKTEQRVKAAEAPKGKNVPRIPKEIETPQVSTASEQPAQRTEVTKSAPAIAAESQMLAAQAPPPDTMMAALNNAPKSTLKVTSSIASKGILSGRVIEAKTGDPLPGATVVVLGTTRGAVTDVDGKFTIVGIPDGTYTIRVSLVGYASIEKQNIQIGSNALIAQDFKLAESAVELKGVDVTAERIIANAFVTNSQTIVSKTKPSQPNTTWWQGNIPTSTYRNFSTEEYAKINENDFLDVRKNPLSTFSIDVDNASYSNVRRFIQDGQFPPQDAVRIEEMINYFTYDYPQPKGEDPFSITTEMSACPWNKDHKLLLIGLQGKKIPVDNLPPSNLVFLLDVSGSMNEPNKLPLVKQAFRLLVNQLREEDKVSIVVYAGHAGLVLPSTHGDEKEEILRAIDNLQAGGSTAGGQGIQLAYRIAQENFIRRGNNRVILATDGDFNVGASSDAEMERLIEEKRDMGIYLSVLGFGTGNYKDSKMEKLADKGNGNYSYIDNLKEAQKVFVGQMAGTLFTIAKDVKLQIEFNPTKVKSYRLIGYENRMLAKEDFNNDKKDAGELGSGHSVTALYEIITPGSDDDTPDVDDLKYQDTRVSREAKHSHEILTVKFRYKPPKSDVSKLIVHPLEDETMDIDETSDNFRWAAAVAEFGMLLRDSKYAGHATFRDVLELAQDARGRDRDGYRAEFIQLVKLCNELRRSDGR